MASTIRLRRSAVPSAVPTTTQLALGEVAINTYDGKMFIKKDNGTESVVEIGTSFPDPGANGIVVRTAFNTLTTRTLTGTTDQITITNGSGVSGAPTFAIASNPIMPGTGSLTLPTGTTGQRPTLTNGMLRYNTTTSKLEGAEGGTWVNLGQTTAAGSNTQIQFNNSGAFGASANLTWDGTEVNITGNLELTGTARRILGDFSNATHSARLAFQTNVTNGNTGVYAITNGTGNSSAFRAFNANDPDNASFVDISILNTTAFLRSDKTGTGTYLPLAITTSGLERMRVTTDGEVVISNTTFTPTQPYTTTGGRLQLIGDNAPAHLHLQRNQTSSAGAAIIALKSNGTTASPSLVSSGDTLSAWVGRGYDGSTYLDGARIEMAVDGTPGATDMPGRLQFLVTPDGSGTPAERMRLQNTGRLVIHNNTNAIAPIFSGTLFSIINDGSATQQELVAYTGAGAATVATNIIGLRSRGSFASPSVPQAGDRLFALVGGGLTNPVGPAFSNTASITMQAEENFTASSAGSRLVFETATIGSTTRTEKMRLDNAGNLLIGTTAAQANAGLLQVNGSIGSLFVSGSTSILAFGATDATNSPYLRLRQSATESRLDAGATGTGTQTPLTFWVNASQRASIGTDGAFTLNAAVGNSHTLEGTAGSNTTPSIIFRGSNSGVVNLWRFGDTRQSAGGNISVLETLNQRPDGNGSFSGRIGASFWRTDGTAIASGQELGTFMFGGVHTGSTTYAPANHLYTASVVGVAEGNFTSSTAMATGLSFRTGATGYLSTAANVPYGTERMRINNTGNITIYTPSVGDALTVNGNIVTTSNFYTSTTNTETKTSLFAGTTPDGLGRAAMAFVNTTNGSGSDSQIDFYTNKFGVNRDVRMSIQPHGNVVIRTPAAGTTLTVNAFTDEIAAFARTTNTWNYASWYTASTRRGGVGVDNSSNFMLFSDGQLNLNAGAGTRITISSGGAVRFLSVGTTASAANAFLDSADNNNLLRSTSSIRYKQDVQDLEQNNVIDQLRPITYRSKCESDDQQKRHYGFIAEEVHEIDPKLVHYTKDEEGNLIPDGVQYERVVVLLTQKVQEQQTQIDQLTALVEKLLQKQ